MTTSPCIKSVNRSALIAFSPHGTLLAAGTRAGVVDLSFSSFSYLEIFEVDFSSVDRELVMCGRISCSESFNRLSWSESVSSSEEFEFGVVAGGFADGDIGVWNPKLLMSPGESKSALVQQLSRHKGPVRGLEFSSLKPNLLASSGEEGEIFIWDFAKPTEPTHFPPLKGSGSATHGDISFLTWNKRVEPILASTSSHGATVIWDLRKQKPIISFSDSVRRRCSVLQWHPDIATQIIVASDDNNSHSSRIWDMRNTMSPVRELAGHTKDAYALNNAIQLFVTPFIGIFQPNDVSGILAMSWCPHDSSYLLTCAKDDRTILWDTNSAEIVSELPAGTNSNFDVHWHPKLPGVISASSFHGKIGIYNIEVRLACARYSVGEDSETLKAPKWHQRKAGVSYGFGGKLVAFHITGPISKASEVDVHDLVTEHSIGSSSSEFEAAMCSGDRSLLRLLCEQKTQESESEDERETWGFLKVMLEDNGTTRTKLLNHLGFSLPAEEVNDTVQNDPSQNLSLSGLDRIEEAKEGFDNGEDFFNNFQCPNFVTEETAPVLEEPIAEHDLQNGNDDSFFDDAIQRALVVGDYKGAVAQCIAANKMADALVIAQIGGDSLWESTQVDNLKSFLDVLQLFHVVVAAMVNNDLASLVIIRPLKSWKETLALICTFSQEDEWTSLCETLASRLVTAGNTLAASLCYICSGNIDRTVEMWSKKVTVGHEGKSCVDLLQDLMEKTMVLALAMRQQRLSASLCSLIEKYAEILASTGLLSTAMEYLKLVDTENASPELVILRDRIALLSELGPVSPWPVPPPLVPTRCPCSCPWLPQDVTPTPPAPSAASPTLQTADVSNVPAQKRTVIETLTRLCNETSEALGGSHSVGAKRREIDDNSKKIGALFAKLNNGDISETAAEKLVQLCQALDHCDFPTALKIQGDLTTNYWDECSFWLATLKRMIKVRQNAR
ncbi:WD40/YVTN repeat-like-containing domain, Ancestral coatomer element 1, Sec16/Sec31 [Artemisia annua]|uniref:WD40/YVTN repeat-like-containing domain, Ancestral coatomer element 1, Sec16/Sec31 n=1 Tax=Artemisia annua TaxID=35608 RepID=A0A2U1KSC2_ARTAN|nr:WD40/YVTN repeat-like-containing domain, Ancestral coatomer element 1, Sec16/Sec31 [Artemisia annua]